MFFLFKKWYFSVISPWRIFWRIHTPKKNSEELREKFSNFELGVFFWRKNTPNAFFPYHFKISEFLRWISLGNRVSHLYMSLLLKIRKIENLCFYIKRDFDVFIIR